MQYKNIWFMGNGNFAALCLENFLVKQKINFSKIITNLPTRSVRNISPVEIKARELGQDVIQTGNLNANENLIYELENNKPDLVFVIDFGQLIKEPFLSLFCLNIHPSLLPEYRGAAPINWVLLNGETETGVTSQQMNEGLDTGDILVKQSTPIGENETYSQLYDRLSVMGAQVLMQTIEAVESGSLKDYRKVMKFIQAVRNYKGRQN